MITTELVSFIKSEIIKGKSKEQIRGELLAGGGWSEGDIMEAFNSINPNSSPIPQSPIIHNKKSKIGIIISLIIVLVMLGGGAYAYMTGYFISLEKVTSSAFESMAQAKSSVFDVTFSLETFRNSKEEENTDPLSSLNNLLGGKVSITTKGFYDKSNPENLLAENTLFVDYKTMNGQVDIKVVDNVLYANLSKAPVIEFLPILSEYENKWFSFPVKSGETNRFLDAPMGTFVGLNSGDLEQVTEEQKQKIYTITKNANFVKILQKLPSENISDTLSYHFIFDLDKVGIQVYLMNLRDYIKEIGKNDSRLSSFDPTIFGNSFDKIENFKGEAWIGRKDNLLRKVQVSFSISEDYTTSNIRTDFVLTGIFKDWNKAMSVNAPSESSDFKTFIEKGPLGQAQRKSLEASHKAKVSSLRATAEIQFESTYPNPSYKGVCDLEEFINTRDFIVGDGGAFQCSDSKNMYYVAIKLESGETYCVDSTGFAGVVSEHPEIREKLNCNP